MTAVQFEGLLTGDQAPYPTYSARRSANKKLNFLNVAASVVIREEFFAQDVVQHHLPGGVTSLTECDLTYIIFLVINHVTTFVFLEACAAQNSDVLSRETRSRIYENKIRTKARQRH